MHTSKSFKHTLLASAIITIASQLDIDIITNGFRVAMASCIISAVIYCVMTISPIMVVSISTVGIMAMRILGLSVSNLSFTNACIQCYPECIFYLVYGLLVSAILKFTKRKPSSIHFTGLVFLIDILSNTIELLIRLGPGSLSSRYIFLIVFVALIRSIVVLMVISFFDEYSLAILKRTRFEQYQNLMMMMAKLQGELIWMEKSSKLIEGTMSNSYKLYSNLDSMPDLKDQAQSALTIAKDIHEIKKEYFLITRGLREVMEEEHLNSQTRLIPLLQLIQESISKAVPDGYQKATIKVNCKCNPVIGRPFLFMSIATNLIVNSIESCISETDSNQKSSDIAPEITISADILSRDYGDVCLITFSDNGPGIPEDILDDIFLPGYSTKINFNTGVTGRGLGLAIVRDIVEEQFNGNLSLETSNKGTTFKIEIKENNLEEMDDD